MHIVHHELVAFLEVAKLLPLDIHHTLGDVECAEGRTKLRPSETVSGGLHVEMTLTPRTDGILELVCGIKDLLMLLAPNEGKLLLYGVEPMIRVEGILRPCEDGGCVRRKSE